MSSYTIDCPVDGCDGEIGFTAETAEDYTAHGLNVWTYTYLVMNDPECGHTFTDTERQQMEQRATDDYMAGDEP